MRSLRILIAALFFTAPMSQTMADDMRSSNVYDMITQQKSWLNTSRALTPEDLKNRIILLDFWTFCCINCIHVMPDLKYLEEKFGDDLTVIGVHSAKFKNEQDTSNIRDAILRYDLHHPVVNDSSFAVWNSFGVRAWPTFVLIAPNGMIQATYAGEGNRAAIERDIEKLRVKFTGKFNKEKLPLALEKDKEAPSVLRFPGKLYAAKDSGMSGADDKWLFFVSDSGHHQITQLMLNGGDAAVSRIGSGVAGFKDGALEEAQFRSPQGVLYDRDNHLLYIADTENHALRVADFNNRTVTTLAGTGKQGYDRNVKDKAALSADLASPWDLAFYPDNKHIVIAMAGLHQLWSYDIDNKILSVIAGNGNESIDDGAYPNNSLSQPSGLSVAGDKLYFVDSETSSLRVLEKGEVQTLIGTGLFDFGYKEGKRGIGLMQHPIGLAATDDAVYIADSYNHAVRRFDVTTGVLSNFAEGFKEPNDVELLGDKLYVADTNNNAIRIIDVKTKKVSTLILQQESAQTFAENLPNLEALEPLHVEPKIGLTLTLELQFGWHINEDAPSYLALFDMSGKAPVLLKNWDTKALRENKLTLLALAADKNYRLQGTLYYCEDKAGAQCLLKSYDVALTPDGKEKAITLKVN